LADPGPDHEGADQIDRVGAGDLAAQLGADVGLALGVDQQVALRQRGRRQRWQRGDRAERGALADPLQDPRREHNLRGLGFCWLPPPRVRPTP
jgi:hypothetical protein